MHSMLSATTPMPRLGLAAMLFGLLTIGSGARALFMGADVGNAVNFVLWFNFLAGFAYVAAGLLILRGGAGALALSAMLALATLVTFSALGLHIADGGAFEGRTIGAMVLRAGFWSVTAALLWRAMARAS